MGWRTTLRYMGTAARTSARYERRRQTELLRQQKQTEKLNALAEAQLEFDLYESKIAQIKSICKECSPEIDWRAISASTEPQSPEYDNSNEKYARKKSELYKPSLLDKIFNRIKKKQIKLNNEIIAAIAKDKSEHQKKESEHAHMVNDWKESVNVAHRVLSGDTVAYSEVVEGENPFEELRQLGSALRMKFISSTSCVITFNVHSDSIIPKEVKSLLKSGKLSVKEMPVTKFNELYQDYVCGALLRIAREIYALLPLENVIVHAYSNMLNDATGHIEQTCILSAMLPRDTVASLNYDTLDPSNAMQNFLHNMNFKKTTGFAKAELIDDGMINTRNNSTNIASKSNVAAI